MSDEDVIKSSDFPPSESCAIVGRTHLLPAGTVYPWSDPMSRTYIGRAYERAGEETFYVYTRVNAKGQVEVYAGTTGIHELDRKVTTIKLPNDES